MNSQKFGTSLFCSIAAAILMSAIGYAQSSTRLTPPANPVDKAFFGMHIHQAAKTTPWPDIPFGSWRLWDAGVTWANIEPAKGKWDFSNLDKDVALAQEHSVNLIVPLALSPAWASSRPQEPSAYIPGLAAPPQNIQDWRDYVHTVATRYKGRVHEYEVWNEPNLKQFWTGSTDQLVALTREAYTIVTQIDPSAKIISPSPTEASGVNWLRGFLQAGGGQYVDVIGYHFYVMPQPPEAIVPLAQQAESVMKQNGASGKPLWDTETGWAKPKPFPSEELAAAYVARSYTLAWASGISRFYWYAWDNHKFSAIEMTESDNKTEKPAAKAYATVEKWLLGARMTSCTSDASSTWICQLDRSGVSSWIIWNANGSTNFSVPASWRAKVVNELLGGNHPLNGSSLQIGTTPVLLSVR